MTEQTTGLFENKKNLPMGMKNLLVKNQYLIDIYNTNKKQEAD